MAEQDKRNAVELAQAQVASAMQKTAVAKDSVKAKLDAGEVARKLALLPIITLLRNAALNEPPPWLSPRNRKSKETAHA